MLPPRVPEVQVLVKSQGPNFSFGGRRLSYWLASTNPIFRNLTCPLQPPPPSPLNQVWTLQAGLSTATTVRRLFVIYEFRTSGMLARPPDARLRFDIHMSTRTKAMYRYRVRALYVHIRSNTNHVQVKTENSYNRDKLSI